MNQGLSLFQRMALTRLRTAVTAGVGLVLWFGVGIPLTAHIREASDSPTADMLMMTALALVMLGAATFLGILIGDYVFPGRWRERFILGRRVQLDIPDDSLEAIKAAKSYFLQFCLIVVALVLGGAFAFESMTGNFFAEYQRTGYTRTALRSDNTEAKLELVAELGLKVSRPHIADALTLLDVVWRDEQQPIEVRAGALKAISRLMDTVIGGNDEAVETGNIGSWTHDAVQHAHEGLAPDLRRELKTAPPKLQIGLMVVLGAMRDAGSQDALWAVVDGEASDTTDRWNAAIVAIGRLRTETALPRLLALASPDRSDRAFRSVAFATKEAILGFHRSFPGQEVEVPKGLDQTFGDLTRVYGGFLTGTSPERRCLAAWVLRFTRDGRMRDALLAGFDAEGAKAIECDGIDVSAGADTLLSEGRVEPLQARILNSLAVIAYGDHEVQNWLDRRLTAGGDTEIMTEVLQNLRDRL